MQEDLSKKPVILSPINTTWFLRHFSAMMGPYGLYQHATMQEPLLSEGYCVDDNARAVQMLIGLLPLVADEQKSTVRALLDRCWNFLVAAEEKPGYFFNFQSAEGQWLPHGRSDDMYARLIRAIAHILRTPEVSELHPQAREMLIPLLDRATDMEAIRYWTELLIAIETLPADEQKQPKIQKLITTALKKLDTAWKKHASSQWPWPEAVMTYGNAIIPHGALAGLNLQPSALLKTIVHQSTAFLTNTTIHNDIFMPIGSNGWYPKGGTASHDNQQAIEANTMFDLLLTYNRIFPGALALDIIAAPYLWFFGKNFKNIVMVNEDIGACMDGIFEHGPNPNFGAESMLAYQWSEILLYSAPQKIQSFILKNKPKKKRHRPKPVPL